MNHGRKSTGKMKINMESKFKTEESIVRMVDQDSYQINAIITNRKVMWLLIIYSFRSLLGKEYGSCNYWSTTQIGALGMEEMQPRGVV